MKRFDLSQKISTHLALMFVLILGFLAAWYSLKAGEEIIKNSKESTSFNFNKRMQKEIPESLQR